MLSPYILLAYVKDTFCFLKKKKKQNKKIQWEKECLINGIETNSYLFGIKIKLDPYTLYHVEKYIYY